MSKEHVLLCWRSERAGDGVLVNAVKKLEARLSGNISKIILLQQHQSKLDSEILGTELVEKIDIKVISLSDPTAHSEVYERITGELLPLITKYPNLHINVSPGTPAMHAVWLILHAGGRFPPKTKLWSTQWNPETKRTSLKEVAFPISTYMSEIRRGAELEPDIVIYDVEPKSKIRRDAFEQIKRFASIPNIPVLVLGERGTGKTRIIETFVGTIKQKEIITVACGGLDSTVADSLIFGHKKGAFTGAHSDRKGVLKEADNRVLFLDEIQDLSQTVQRKLVRVLQDNKHRFRPLGSDQEESSSFELICASNKSHGELEKILDPDFLDRISMLTVTIPPLRQCKEDLTNDWYRVWQELNSSHQYSSNVPLSGKLKQVLIEDNLSGNLRDLQKLAVLIMAYWDSSDIDGTISKALELWQVDRNTFKGHSIEEHSLLTRDEHLKRFRSDLAKWARAKYDSWENAAEKLGCTAKTLRSDARLANNE